MNIYERISNVYLVFVEKLQCILISQMISENKVPMCLLW